jgi:hypothetical protein
MAFMLWCRFSKWTSQSWHIDEKLTINKNIAAGLQVILRPILISRKRPSKLMKFEFEQFSTIEDVFLYLVSVAPYMKQVLPVSSYKGYVFSFVPLTPLSGDVVIMVYTKGSIGAGMVEFDISTKKYKSVTGVERADKNYFIILIPKSTSISDRAIAQLESIKK